MNTKNNATRVHNLMIQLSYESSKNYNECQEKIKKYINNIHNKAIYIDSNLLTLNIFIIKTKIGNINCYTFQTISMNSVNNDKLTNPIKLLKLNNNKLSDLSLKLELNENYELFLNSFNKKDISKIQKYIYNNILLPDITYMLAALTCKTDIYYNYIRNSYLRYRNSNNKDSFIIELMNESNNKFNFPIKLLMESYHYTKQHNQLNNFISESKNGYIYFINGCYTQIEIITEQEYQDQEDLNELILTPLSHSVMYILNKNSYFMMYDPDTYIVPNKKYKMFNDLGYQLKLLYEDNPIQSIDDNDNDIYCLFHCIRFMIIFCENIKNSNSNIDSIKKDIMKITKGNIIKNMINWIINLMKLLEI